MMNMMLKILMIELKRWWREQMFRLKNIDRMFYCQRDIEGNSKCKKQCEHCKEYYKPVENK